MVLAPRAEDADFLNINRPVFSRRGLKVVLWCDEATTLALARNAVDFFDWISRRHECPPGVPTHAVYGIRAALCARAPGIAWTGGDLEACFRAALPGRELIYLDMMRPLPELENTVRAAGRAWIACKTQSQIHEEVFDYLFEQAGRRARRILVEPRWVPHGRRRLWEVNAWCMDLHVAVHTMQITGGLHKPGRLIALGALDPDVHTQIAILRTRGSSEQAIEHALRSASDPAAALARMLANESRNIFVGGDSRPLAVRAFGRQGYVDHVPEWARQSRFSKTRPKTMAKSLAMLARNASREADPQTSEPLARLAMAVTEQVLGGASLEHALALQALATTLARTGRFEEAEEHLRRSLSIARSLDVDSGIESLPFLHDLAEVVTSQGRYPEAEEILLQELDRLRRFNPTTQGQAEQRLAHLRELIARGRGGSKPT